MNLNSALRIAVAESDDAVFNSFLLGSMLFQVVLD